MIKNNVHTDERIEINLHFGAVGEGGKTQMFPAANDVPGVVEDLQLKVEGDMVSVGAYPP